MSPDNGVSPERFAGLKVRPGVLPDLAGKTAVVMGLGLFGGGVESARFLHKCGARVVVTDLRSAEVLGESVGALSDLPVEFVLGRHDEALFRSADLILVSPAVPPDSPYLLVAVEAGCALDTEINLFFKLCPGRIVGVTGSNGKSTTTALIGEILRAAGLPCRVGGDIGQPLLNVAAGMSPDEIAVLELSSFQLERLRGLRKSPWISVVTNLSPNHLDRHKTFEAYAEAKRAILDCQSESNVTVLNADDPNLDSFAACSKGRLRYFSARHEVHDGAFAEGHAIVLCGRSGKMRLDLPANPSLPGVHNLMNLLAATAAATAAGATDKAVLQAAASYKALEHRLEFVREVNGVRYYNDSIATTPESTVAALTAFPKERIILIAGGSDKGLDLAPAVSAAARIKRLITIGATAGKIERLAAELPSNRPPMTRSRSLEEAVTTAQSEAVPGDVILLSPACASYDMFRNFVERGRRFKELVEKLSL